MDLNLEVKKFLAKVFKRELNIEKQEMRLLEKAIPQYEKNHLEKVNRIANNSPTNLVVLGNYMYGVSIIDIIMKSREYTSSTR